jgi:hypothetical protein
MTQPAINTTATEQLDANQRVKSNQQAWYRPTFSPEHGVYVVLLVSFLTGAAAAQDWTLATTLALVCAFCGFQAEHPLVQQIKQRRSLKPRFLVWGGLYAGVSLAIALWLYLSHPVLLWIYLGAIAAFVVDAFSVLHREQKSVVNELITFAAVCLSAPLAYAATTGTISTSVMGLWALNTLFFSSSIFTVKLRKTKTSSVIPGVVYHAIATVIIFALYWLGWLSPVTVLAFGVALLKFGIVAWNQQWYRTTKIQYVAMLETGAALSFLIIVALSVLPAHLTVR